MEPQKQVIVVHKMQNVTQVVTLKSIAQRESELDEETVFQKLRCVCYQTTMGKMNVK